MMWIGFLIGALYGAIMAFRRGGSWGDIAQYAVVMGLIALILFVLASIIINRMF